MVACVCCVLGLRASLFWFAVVVTDDSVLEFCGVIRDKKRLIHG